MRGVYIKELGKYVETEFAREYFAKKKQKCTNTQILEKLDKIIELLVEIKTELKGGGLLEGNTGGVKAENRVSETGAK